MTVTTTYPAGPITPHGSYHVLKGIHPQVAYRSYDDKICFWLMGGQAIADPTKPERIQLKSLKGLLPPWDLIDQQGANQDGVTFLDAVYNPIEVDANLVARGRDARHTRKVIRDWIASNDAKKVGELSWTTHELGRWWAPVRWMKTPVDQILGAQNKRQEFGWTWRADDAFWRSYDDVDVFEFAYDSMVEKFPTPYPTTLGPNWPQYYTGTGGGFCFTDGDRARWFDDPDDPTNTAGRTVVNGPYKDFSTGSDYQVAEILLGSIPEWSFPDLAYNDIWLRMGRTGGGAWNGYGIRFRIGFNGIKISRFNNFVETVLASKPMLIPPLPGSKWRAVAGYTDNLRLFKLFRDSSEILSAKEVGTGSMVGSSYRGIGFGMHAGAAAISQATPAMVRKVSAGDNSNATQSGSLRRVNAGDQDAWDRYTCYGPGTFRFANGPGGEMIEFGPLLPNQIVQIRTEPRKRGVVDLTSVPSTAAEKEQYKKAIADALSFASGGNTAPMAASLESAFGVRPPQGNLYALLRSRFTNPIPAKLPGDDLKPVQIAVEIVGGTASSKVIAALTPLRRYPA